jgi:acyl-CoA reductase-like NAD-dependent aldehyde dehydrogenase
VFTVIPGPGRVVGERFISHPAVRKICFTGSTEVGKRIMRGCADQVKRLTLELGGKSANIVFADADLERAAASAPASVFDNAGQDCCARSRILVQRSVYDRFLELLEPAVQGFRVQDPSLETAEMGPLISDGQRTTVQSFVDVPTSRSAGSCPTGPGTGSRRPCCWRTAGDEPHWREEIFGPGRVGACLR